MNPLRRLNAASPEEAMAELLTCCGSREWARRMAARRPFADAEALLVAADAEWEALALADCLEAFRAHPRIGERRSAGPRTERERRWSAGEQAGMAGAEEETRRALAAANRDYERRFGHIFIVCATGLGAGEMLERLRARLGNDPDTELRIAAEEQRRITRLRLRKLLEHPEPTP